MLIPIAIPMVMGYLSIVVVNAASVSGPLRRRMGMTHPQDKKIATTGDALRRGPLLGINDAKQENIRPMQVDVDTATPPKPKPYPGTVGHLMHLRLINTVTNQPVPGFDPIVYGSVVDVAILGTRNLTVEAVPVPPAYNTTKTKIGSVQFDLDSKERYRIENGSPWLLCGNDDDQMYISCTKRHYGLDIGRSHRVTATSYGEMGATGTEIGNTVSVWFALVDSSTPPPDPDYNELSSQLILVDADTDLDIDVLENRYLVEIAEFPRINIRAEPYPFFPTQSVVFKVDNEVVRIENFAPYALNGNRGPDYFPWTPTKTGTTYIEATPYSQKHGQGLAGPKASVSILIRVPQNTTGGEW